MTSTEIPDLFELGQKHFRRFVNEFASYGIKADPKLEMRRGQGILCYYSLEDRQIYLSVPDLAAPTGKLQALLLRGLLGCESNEDLIYFFRLFLPHIVAHELTHHYRHRYNKFDPDNLWHEEQVANKLAVAVVKHRLSPADKAKARQFLRRAIDTLARQMEEKNIAVDSYHSVLHALNVSGEIDVSDFENIELLQRAVGASEEMLLEGSGQLSDDFLQRLEQRDDLIGEINQAYASNQMKYIYYHLGWLYLDLTSRETEYVDEFARNYLGLGVELLPSIEANERAGPQGLLACYLAYQQTSPRSVVVARYFYKRYRSLLLTLVQQVNLAVPGQNERLKRETRLLLESWNEAQSDTLDYLAQMAPPGLRPYFPHLIANHPGLTDDLTAALPAEADRRLWDYVVNKQSDEAAANTLRRLSMLDHTDIYRPLPAELMLELAKKFSLVRFAKGETVIWQDEHNDDVYFLLEGGLKVLVTHGGVEEVVANLHPGEMFGEIAFFTEDPRSASVRAVEPSRCFVLTDADLQLMAYNHPTILMRMASSLAKRLTDMYEQHRSETL